MSRLLVIGAGGVGNVAAVRSASWEGFYEEIWVASRTEARCRDIAGRLPVPTRTAGVDACDPAAVAALLRESRADVVINAALPEHNLPVMDACLEAGAHYVDTSAPEPDPTRYELFAYRWQLAYRERFAERGLAALLSVGFDPGVTNIFCAHAARHWFDTIETLDILDCNGGSHGRAFATNFNPLTNIQEITQTGLFWEEGAWREFTPFSLHAPYPFPEIGEHEVYALYHEELETLVERLPGLRRARFWMHFNDSYLTHLRVLQDLGLTSMEPVDFGGVEVRPLEFLAKVLPDPARLGEGYAGRTNIGCLFQGTRDGRRSTRYLYNVCDHAAAFAETGSQAISYTTGVPAALAARLLIEGIWRKPGVHLPEELDPDPFMDRIGAAGLPWKVLEDPPLIAPPAPGAS